MTNPTQTEQQKKFPLPLVDNWISLVGVIVMTGGLFAVLCLFAMDFFSGTTNPYMGILTFFVAPAFVGLGLAVTVVGILIERRRRVHIGHGEHTILPVVDLNRPSHRKALGTLVGGGAIFLLLTAVGSYRSYHFTESKQFCGQTCHEVMSPEFTAYQNSPHARVSCVECHIGEGATWFVKSKLSGSYQVYATLFNKYPRPIPTPIKNLRPAQETCEQCHWPSKFYGSAERVNPHYLSDESNTPWTVSLLMKIGGGDPTHGPVGGIHWHMNIANKTEYIATDEARQKIAWIRFTDANGKVTIYRDPANPLTPDQIAAAEPRRMDCMDCHNRPSHIYHPPDRAVDIAMSTGRIPPQIPWIKKQAVEVLTKEYTNNAAARVGIEQGLGEFYATKQAAFARQHPKLIQQAIKEVQTIYSQNFFPEMKVNWKTYPNHIGHTMAPGCFRCHDGKHVNPEGKAISKDCNSCHIIIAQGNGEKLMQISPKGLEFEHPVDIADAWKEMNCFECHTGGSLQ